MRVYKMDYNKVLEYHIAKSADVTVVCKEVGPNEDVSRFGTIKMNESMRIEEFEEKPMVAQSQIRIYRYLCNQKTPADRADRTLRRR